MERTSSIRVAAVQLRSRIGANAENIESCRRLGEEAVSQGAIWIALPEFFNTGMAWDPALVRSIEDEEGPAATFLKQFSRDHQVFIGGSFLCRLDDGSVRNRYMGYHHGRLVGVHDKDHPSSWENAFYEGGSADDAEVLGEANSIRVGSAVCWEFMRSSTPRRLRERVDLIMGGSCWWSMPDNWPRWLARHDETYNSKNSVVSIQETARLAGAPVVHGSHCGDFSCPILGLPLSCRVHFEGNALIVDASGEILASRSKDEGEGVIYADIIPESVSVQEKIPTGFWLLTLGGFFLQFAWFYHRWLGRRWYHRHVKRR